MSDSKRLKVSKSQGVHMLATANMGKWQQDILATCTNGHVGNGDQRTLRKIPISHNTNHPKCPFAYLQLCHFPTLHIMVIAWNVLHPSSTSPTLFVPHLSLCQFPTLPTSNLLPFAKCPPWSSFMHKVHHPHYPLSTMHITQNAHHS